MAIEAHKAELAAMNAELRRLADLDPLTGLPNRRSLFERAERMRAHARRHEEALSLLLIDVDRFKQVNDESGHARGDEVLVAIVDAIRREVRADDLFARFGGEEFVVLLAHCPVSRAAEVAERMRARVEGLALHHPFERCVTISIGVSHLDLTADRAFDEALERADRSLYAAKRDGRNRVGPAGPAGAAGPSERSD
jgi:diguanylate cyclase (GGDEF)-like protein